MNDYYSQFPGPTRNEAIKIIKDKIIKDNSMLYWSNDKKIDLIIEQYIDEEFNKDGSLGSYTGWNLIVLPSIIKKLMIHLT